MGCPLPDGEGWGGDISRGRGIEQSFEGMNLVKNKQTNKMV